MLNQLSCKKKELITNSIVIAIMVLFMVLTCLLENTESLLLTPLMTAQQFLNSIPYDTVTLFGTELVVQQISSTVMVWGLGVLIVACGVVVYIKRGYSPVGRYWGIGLVLWGLGAIVAGVSYQIFGYELKANGYEYVLFTSNWELCYMILTAFATNYMLVGTAHAALKGKLLKYVHIFAFCHCIAYGVYMLVGSILAIESIISYFGFTQFVAIDFMLMFAMNIWHYVKHKDKLNIRMVFTWGTFAVVNIAYFVCYYIGMGSIYTNTGIWFNENDVLHLLLMVWAVHVLVVLLRYIPAEQCPSSTCDEAVVEQ